jgi:FKBP-type peptidyl-prolyl cis-trans isomerase (trigger factor)
MDLDTYFKLRNTTREQFVEEEVKPVAKKRFERSLILDEIVRSEKLEVDNASLDAEFNQTLSSLAMQGLDLSKIKGGRKRQQELAQAVAMESANRVLTRRALEVLKSIATGEYRTEQAQANMEAEGGPVAPVEGDPNATAPDPEPAASEPESKSEDDSSLQAEPASEPKSD